MRVDAVADGSRERRFPPAWSSTARTRMAVSGRLAPSHRRPRSMSRPSGMRWSSRGDSHHRRGIKGSRPCADRREGRASGVGAAALGHPPIGRSAMLGCVLARRKGHSHERKKETHFAILPAVQYAGGIPHGNIARRRAHSNCSL